MSVSEVLCKAVITHLCTDGLLWPNCPQVNSALILSNLQGDQKCQNRGANDQILHELRWAGWGRALKGISMLARQKFQKALMLLDRGALDRGEVTLREVVAESASEGDTIALVQGLVCLGELLHASGRFAEARLLLARALQEKRDDDLLAQEFERAKALLSTSSSSLPYAMQLQRRRRNGARFGKVFGLIRLRTGTRDSDP